jgi:hypothetical protein
LPLAVLLRRALAGAILFGLALLSWLAIVAPMNGVLATWTAGPVPANFDAVRNRWEAGHIVVAARKAIGFACVALAVLMTPSAASPSGFRTGRTPS